MMMDLLATLFTGFVGGFGWFMLTNAMLRSRTEDFRWHLNNLFNGTVRFDVEIILVSRHAPVALRVMYSDSLAEPTAFFIKQATWRELIFRRKHVQEMLGSYALLMQKHNWSEPRVAAASGMAALANSFTTGQAPQLLHPGMWANNIAHAYGQNLSQGMAAGGQLMGKPLSNFSNLQKQLAAENKLDELLNSIIDEQTLAALYKHHDT